MKRIAVRVITYTIMAIIYLAFIRLAYLTGLEQGRELNDCIVIQTYYHT